MTVIGLRKHLETKQVEIAINTSYNYGFGILSLLPYGATAPIWAFAYLHETLRFTSVF
jgi:hypothetical protein